MKIMLQAYLLIGVVLGMVFAAMKVSVKKPLQAIDMLLASTIVWPLLLVVCGVLTKEILEEGALEK